MGKKYMFVSIFKRRVFCVTDRTLGVDVKPLLSCSMMLLTCITPRMLLPKVLIILVWGLEMSYVAPCTFRMRDSHMFGLLRKCGSFVRAFWTFWVGLGRMSLQVCMAFETMGATVTYWVGDLQVLGQIQFAGEVLVTPWTIRMRV